MSKFRQIQTNFWSNPYIQEEMTAEDRYFYLYLMTNEKTTQIGVYGITKKQMAFDLGYSIESVKALLKRFETHHKLIKYDEETYEIVLLKWGRYNLSGGGKPIEDLIKKEILKVKNKEFLKDMYNDCPENKLKEFIKKVLREEVFKNAINNKEEIINNEKSEKDSKNDTSDDTYNDTYNDTGAINNKEEIINNNNYIYLYTGEEYKEKFNYFIQQRRLERKSENKDLGIMEIELYQKRLFELSKGNEETALKILEKAIMRNWRDFYLERKGEDNGNSEYKRSYSKETGSTKKSRKPDYSTGF